jgi:two-component system response regulator VicR
MMAARHRILLLEDDPNLGQIVQEHLQMNGYDVRLCANGEDGADAFRHEEYDLCLVDIMMPRKDGFTFAREVRARDQETPIIFLTAKSLKEDRIEGFKIGGDDYITKPFSVEELLLRIQAVLKRTKGATPVSAENLPTDFALGSYKFDFNRRILRKGKTEQKLTPKEADLLRLLCLKMNDTLTRDEALREVWGDDSYFSGRSMDVFVSRLRKYLRDDDRVEIMGVHGKGFRLVVS